MRLIIPIEPSFFDSSHPTNPPQSLPASSAILALPRNPKSMYVIEVVEHPDLLVLALSFQPTTTPDD